MRIIRYADVPPTPWANGAGGTRELWSDATRNQRNFTRRISIAILSCPAPFSSLPGMARTLMPLDDIALRLVIDGQIINLDRFETVRFAGHSTVSLIMLDRPGRVLNVMSNLAEWDHHVSLNQGVCDAAVLLKGACVEGVPLAPADLILQPEGTLLSSLTVATIGFTSTCDF